MTGLRMNKSLHSVYLNCECLTRKVRTRETHGSGTFRENSVVRIRVPVIRVWFWLRRSVLFGFGILQK